MPAFTICTCCLDAADTGAKERLTLYETQGSCFYRCL
jgi:hypothetical protein